MISNSKGSKSKQNNEEHGAHAGLLHSNNIMSTEWPTTSEQRALAYAPKPFALLSFLSSLFVMYYLLIRHPEKRKRMYHRLMLSTFGCFLPLSFAIFWGTWAMPAELVPWAVGDTGTSLTCSIQGFIIIVFYLAFPFYYASFSVFAYVALKNNFEEEKYVWMEKWIHVGAYFPPLTLAIIAAVKDWIKPNLTCCGFAVYGECDNYIDCQHDTATKVIAPWVFIVFVELIVGTVTIIYLICSFESIQKEVDTAIGMKQLREKARKQRTQQVALQTGLYLASFWFGYLPSLVEDGLRLATGHLNYALVITANCIFAFQGFVIMVIYFVLQQKSARITPVTIPGVRDSVANDTVSKLRENAARPERVTVGSTLSRFSFCVFDGSPAEDSPWRDYFDDDAEEGAIADTDIILGGDTGIGNAEEDSLVTSLLSEESN